MEASFLGCVLASLLSSFGLVQQVPTDLKPLEVSNVAVERDTSGVPSMLRFNLTNKSSKPVDAYVVQIDYLDASKQMRTQSTRLSARGVFPTDGKASGFAPGETWSDHYLFHRVVSQSDGTSLLTGEVKITLDYVAFGDGSTWGPDSAKRSLELQGIKSGVLWERDRLNELLKEKGAGAVLEDLARPIAH